MKKIYSCLIILTFFASCTNDENSRQDIIPASKNKGIGSSDILPAYSSNPYDNAGRICDEIFDAYYDGTSRPTNVQAVIAEVEDIANSSTLFMNISGSYQPLSEERIQYLSNRTSEDIVSIIGASSLSATANTNYSNFLISFSALYDSEPDAFKIYISVVNYEETILTNGLLTANDKRIILTSTSVLRYTAYRAKKKPKKNTDPDWLISVTHAFGTEEGAEENMAKAIVEGLVTGIVSNK